MDKFTFSHSALFAAHNAFAEAAAEPAQADGGIVLKRVRIVEVGEAKGHGVHTDEKFVRSIVQLAANRKIKARFDHPGLCSPSFGTYIGYYTNFQVQEKGAYATADLHLSKTASKSPQGDLTTYINELAAEAPDMFGNSIVFSGYSVRISELTGKEFHRDEDTYDVWLDDENHLYDAEIDGRLSEKLYARATQFHASDLVDEPAATSSLYGSGSLLTQVRQMFGLDYRGARKTAEMKQFIQLFSDTTMNTKKFDINATTSDGTAIVVQTDNDYIGVGDTVVDGEGNAVPDGDHTITSSDSGQSGIVITTVDGTITAIAEAAEEPAPPAETQASATADPYELSALATRLTKLSAEVLQLRRLMKDIDARIDLLSKSPATDAAPVKTAPVKKKYQSVI